MADNKKTIDYYFNPFILSFFLFFLIMSFNPMVRLWLTVKTFKGYSFSIIMSFVLLFITFRVLKYFVRLIANKPALTITSERLYDFQTGITFDLSDIIEFEMGGLHSTFISIKLKDNEKYIKDVKNPIKRLNYRIHTKLFGYPFSLTVTLLKGNNNSIFDNLNSHLSYPDHGSKP